MTELGRPSRKPSADRRSKLAARVELAVGYALIAASAILFAYVAGWISPGSITSAMGSAPRPAQVRRPAS